MTNNPRTPEPTTIRRQELGQQLQALRKASGYTLDQAAARISVSPSKLCRIEKGQRSITLDELGGLLSVYYTEAPKRSEILALASNSGERGWWQRNRPDRVGTLKNLETRAESIIYFTATMVPSLLQTSEYARAIMQGSHMMSESEIERSVAARLDRQSILIQQKPPTVLALIDELALHRVIGGPGVLRRQLEHVQELSHQGHLVIRVVPNGGAHPGILGDFELIRHSERSPVVFVEQAASSLFVEEQEDIDVYDRIVQELSDVALDETQSVHLIASLANARTRGRATDEQNRSRHGDLAQEQP